MSLQSPHLSFARRNAILPFAIAALAAAPLLASAAEARPTFGAQLSLPNGISFAPIVFDEIWKGHGADGSPEAFTMECGAGTSENATDGALRFTGRASFTQGGDGIDAEWAVVPDSDGNPMEVCVQAMVAKSKCAGGVSVDGRLIPIVEGVPPDPHLFRGAAGSLEFIGGDGTTWLSIAFPEKANVLVQDNSQWGKARLAIRLMLAYGPVEEGREYALRATFSSPGEPLCLVKAEPVEMVASAEWIPMPAPPAGEDWIETGSALDFSSVVPHHKPAGKFGRVMVVGDHFELERRPGEEIRFCGANIVHNANIPDPESADRFAANLARLGYNSVRIHHHDPFLASPKTVKPRGDGAALDVPQEAWERFDALVAACIRHGLYITTDLYVSRYKAMTCSGIGIDRPGRVEQRELKVLFAFNEGAYSNLVAWTRVFLTHVNPYTGRSLAEEPALCSLALVNEGNLGNDGIQMLAKVPEVAEAWGRPLPLDIYGSPGSDPAIGEFALFLARREERLFERLSAEVRALGCRAPLSNLSSWYYPAQYLLPISRFDYMDSHFYVDHPAFLGKKWRFPSSCSCDNPFRTGADVPAAAWRRLLGKPYCITEWNWSAPCPYRSASGLAIGALAARQGWSGLWRFAWSHNHEGVEAPGSLPMRYFDLHSDPANLASERATLALFLRGDMAPLPPQGEYAAAWDEKSLQGGAIGAPRLGAPVNGVSPWERRVGARVVGDGTGPAAQNSCQGPGAPAPENSAASKSVVSPAQSGNVTISPSGAMLVVTPRTAGGFAESGAYQAGPLKFEIVASPVSRSFDSSKPAAETPVAATVWASSLDGQPLDTSSRILLSHVTDARNTGAVFGDSEGRVWQEQGRTPALVRRGIANIELTLGSAGGAGATPPSFAVFRLSPSGKRLDEVPSKWDHATGTLSFTADTAYDQSCATIFYEVLTEQP